MRKRIFSVVLSMFMICTFILSDFSALVVHADSGASDRQKAYIEFASEKMKVNESGLSSLSKDEMRVLGVFLSNFYTPWQTQLVQTDDNDRTREQMASILTDSLQFDESLASDITDAVFQMSVDSASELSLQMKLTIPDDYASSEDIASDSIGAGDTITGKLPVTYYELLNFTFDTCFCILNYVTTSGDSAVKVYTFSESDSPLYLIDNKTGNIVFELSDESVGLAILRRCIASCYLDLGYGFNLFSVTESAEKVDFNSSNISSIFESVHTVEDLYKTSALSWKLYIDCFGNISVDCGTGRQYVLVPACMNPYTWEKDGYSAGECFPMNNLGMFSAAESGDLWLDAQTSEYALKTDLTPLLGSSTSDIALRVVRGSTSSDLGSNWVFPWDVDESGTLNDLVGYSASQGNLPGYGAYVSLGGTVGEGLFGWLGFTAEENITSIFITPNAVSHEDGGSYFKSSYAKTEAIQDFIMFDTLGLFDSSNMQSMVLNPYGIFADEMGTSLTGDLQDKFRNYLLGDTTNGLVELTSEQQKCITAGIYCAYVFAYFEDRGTDKGGHVNFRFSSGVFPEIGSGAIEITDTSMSEMQEQVLTMAYLFLHPKEGVAYVGQMINTKVEGVLLKGHSDLVGNTNTGSTTGSTKYLGTSGYMATPEITDFEWLNSLFNLYIDNAVYILLFIVILMGLYVMSGTLGYQRAVINAIIFSFCVYLLPVGISSLTSFSNEMSNSFYKNKFTYWGIVQHQAYITELEQALEEENYGDYLVTMFKQQNATSNSNVVTLKWMCPKKDNYLVNIQSEMVESTNSSVMNTLLGGIVNNQVSGEDYTRSANKTYLYRSYVDLATYASSYYTAVGTSGKQVNGTDILQGVYMDADSTYYDLYTSYLSSTADLGGLYSSESFGFNYNTSISDIENKRFAFMNRSLSLRNAMSVDFGNVTESYDSFGVPTPMFNYTVANFNKTGSIPAENVSLSVFALYSESPFYYLNWNLRDQLRSASSTSGYPVKSLLLSNQGWLNDYFYNVSSSVADTDSYGELRDYMDMRSFFTLVVPYLKKCNDVVIQFDKQYDLKMISDFKVEYSTDANGVMSIKIPYGLDRLTDTNKEDYYEYWHDVQVANLFNMYTPWVDTLYACSYAKTEKVTVAGVDYVISDPLNPSMYPDGRPMVFSESERVYYGLSESDLTTVERKILKVNQACYNSLVSLMNYYTFDTDVLITAVAMQETFEFNREFSENPVFGKANVLYPQAFELKNFSFDAYFRLALSEATGYDLNSSTSIYEQVVDDTSVFTAFLIVLVDLSAVWFIPFLRLAFTVLIFLMCTLIIISSCIRDSVNIRQALKALCTSVLIPLSKFLLVTVLSAWVVSLFLASGYTGITGDLDYTISLGDPVFAILALLTVNIVLIVVYFKTIWGMLKDLKVQFKTIKASVVGMGAGLVALAGGAVMRKSDVATDVGAPLNADGTSKAKTPKLHSRSTRFDANNRLARRELREKHAKGAKSFGKKLTSPITNARDKVNTSRENERNAQEEIRRKQESEARAIKQKEEMARQKEADARHQADLNAEAMVKRQKEEKVREQVSKDHESALMENARRDNLKKREKQVQNQVQAYKRNSSTPKPKSSSSSNISKRSSSKKKSGSKGKK